MDVPLDTERKQEVTEAQEPPKSSITGIRATRKLNLDIRSKTMPGRPTKKPKVVMEAGRNRNIREMLLVLQENRDQPGTISAVSTLVFGTYLGSTSSENYPIDHQTKAKVSESNLYKEGSEKELPQSYQQDTECIESTDEGLVYGPRPEVPSTASEKLLDNE